MEIVRTDELARASRSVLSNWAWLAFAALGLGLFAAYSLVHQPFWSDTAYNSTGLVAAIAICFGVRLHRPRAPLAWYLIAIGIFCFVAGDVLYTYYEFVLHVETPWPSWADAFYLGGYPLMAAGLLLLIRARTDGRDRGGLLDSLIVATGLGALLWIFLVGPSASDPSLTLLERVITMAYPLADLALLAVMARFMTSLGKRSWAYVMLLGSFLLLFVADVVYGLQSLAGSYTGGGFTTDGFWLLSYILAGAAALHPSMRRLSAPHKATFARLSLLQLSMLAAAFLVMPLTLGGQALLGAPLDVSVIVVASVLLIVLLFVRMRGLVTDIETKVSLLEEKEEVLRASLEEGESLGERLHHQAFHDPLTGAANRRLFMDRVDHALLRRRGNGEPPAVMFLDLDDFKTVNDSFGHSAGDELLCETALRLAKCVRLEDTVCRLGGDEFAILIEGDGDREVATIAARILEQLEKPVELGTRTVTLRASVGIVLAAVGDSADDLLQRADLAMYQAKTAGKSRYAFYEPGQLNASLSRKLASDLKRALHDGDVELHYQPIVSLQTGRVAGVEALARWEHPSLGPIPPNEFIKIAESSSLIIDFDLYVFGKATRQLAAWCASEGPTASITISVNVSALTLRQASFPERVAELLLEAGVAGSSIVLEVTETALLEDGIEVRERLEALNRLGIRIALDDFGTGYSSLAHLRDLPIDILKIDRSFVEKLPFEQSADLVGAIVSLGRRFSLTTIVAEGIETPEQLGVLRSLQCEFGQGYLFARPGPPESVEALLSREFFDALTKPLPLGPQLSTAS